MNLKQYLIAGLFLLACLMVKAQTQTQAPAYLKGSEVQAYNQHALEVSLLAKTAVGEEMARMTLNGHIKDEAKMAAIRALLTERETREATYQFIYPDDEVARYQARQQVSNDYKTTLIRDLFLAGEIVGSYNCRMVMRNKDTLRLSSAQQAKIVETAVELDQLLEKDPKMDSRGYELAAFRKIMSQNQVNLYLTLKLVDEVKGQVATSWTKLKDNQLDYGLDSAGTSAELYRYHMSRDKAIYLYYNNDSLRNASVDAINNAAPLAIRRINAIPAAQKAKAAYNGSFSW
jgi:hypothetical protein